MSKTLTLKPRLSEKAYGQSESANTYVFDIPKATNSQQVAQAVAVQYDVGVKIVRISAGSTKNLRSYKGRGRFIKASRSNLRKAYVTLNEGDKLPLFAAEEKTKKGKEKN